MSERRVRDTKGNTYVITYDDKTGEQTGISQLSTASEQPERRPIGDTIGGIRANTPADTFRENFAAPIRSGLVTGGRVAGGAIAAPTGPVGTGVGAVLGGMAGDQTYQILQSMFPKLFGQRQTTNPLESATESGLNTLIDYGVEKFTTPISSAVSQAVTRTGRQNLKNRILTDFFNINPTIPVQEALRADPKFPVDVAQATQNSKAKTIRDVLFRQDALNEFNQQQNILNQQANDFLTVKAGKPTTVETSPAVIANRAAVSGEAERMALRAEEKAAYQYAEDKVIPKIKTQAIVTQNQPQSTALYGPNGQPIKSIPKQTAEVMEIQGPVYLKNTMAKASEIVSDINKVLEDKTNMMTTDPEAVNSLTKLRDKLNIFVQVPVDIAKALPVISYQSAKANKQILSDFLETAPESVKQRYVKSIEAMRNLLSKDIHETANTQWPQEAKDALNAAYNKTKAMVSRFDPNIARGLTTEDPNVVKENILNQALSNVQLARQFKATVGSRDELGTAYAQKILSNAKDNRGFFDGTKAFEEYYRTFDIAKEALNANERKSFEYLMRRMQAVDPKLSEAGHVAFAIRHGGAVLGLSVGLIRGISNAIQTGDISEGAKSGATAGAITGGAFVGTVALAKPLLKKLLFDPKNARIAAQLVSAPPQSSQAQILTRALLKTAFKGAQIQTQYGPFIVAPDGKLDQAQE